MAESLEIGRTPQSRRSYGSHRQETGLDFLEIGYGMCKVPYNRSKLNKDRTPDVNAVPIPTPGTGSNPMKVC
jgi:hypothetical protein